MFGISTIIKLLLTLIIIGLIIASAWYVTGMREQLVISENNNQKLEQAVIEQQDVLHQMRIDIKSIKSSNDRLQKLVQSQNKDINNLQNKFEKTKSGKTRDINKIALRKPQVVEKIINNATVDAFRCLEVATGSKLTQEEMYGDKVNKECPSLINFSTNK